MCEVILLVCRIIAHNGVLSPCIRGIIVFRVVALSRCQIVASSCRVHDIVVSSLRCVLISSSLVVGSSCGRVINSGACRGSSHRCVSWRR